MKVWVNEITGIADAITSMYFSKKSWTREKEEYIRDTVNTMTKRDGSEIDAASAIYTKYDDWMKRLLKWGRKHTTMLSFINFSCTVEGLHRAGQDDWDSHAKRFNNRIIRTSTRVSFHSDELSDFYKGKIIPTDVALAALGLITPERITYDGKKYVKTTNGYVLEEYSGSMDVRRGLYMLGLPSNFIFSCDLYNYAHVFKQRNKDGGANPEVKELAEEITRQLGSMQSKFTRDYILSIDG